MAITGTKLSQVQTKLEDIKGTERIYVSDNGTQKYIQTDQLATSKQLESKANKEDIPDISNLATKEDISDLNSSINALPFLTIEYFEGQSDEDGYISKDIVPSEDPSYTYTVLSVMYLHPTLNMWCPCVSYQTVVEDENKIVTGGIRGSAVVIGGSVQAQTFGNCTYRVFCLKIRKK